MFWFGLFLLLCGIAGSIAFRIAYNKELNEWKRRGGKTADYGDQSFLTASRVTVWAGIGAFLICFIIASLSVIPIGTVGVQTVFGKMQERVLHEGLNFKNPLAAVTKMTVQTQTYTMSITSDEGQKEHPDAIRVLSKDNLEVNMDLSVLYSLQASAAQQTYRHLGDTEAYTEKLVRPSIRTAIRDVASRYVAADLMSSARTQAEVEIGQAVSTIFREYFKAKGIGDGILCERVLLRNVQPPQTLKTAIEDKLAKQQQRDAMQFVLETEKAKAQQKVIEAQGLADSQAIINRTLTKEYLQWKYIEVIGSMVNSPNHSTIILPFDQKLTPMLNVGDK